MEEIKKDMAVVQKEKTAVAKKAESLMERLHGSWKDRIERMLPDPKMIDQFMYCAETQYGKNKTAFDGCTQLSVLTCLLTSAKYGLLPDGRNAYLIPYGNECTIQFDYKGLVHIVLRDGTATKIQAEVVCTNDKFVWRNDELVTHEINLPRGEVIGAYCVIHLANGEKQYELMDIDDINKIKACSRGSSSPSSPWNTFFKEMAKKTVFRRATKWIKLSPDVMDAIRADDEAFEFNDGNVLTKRQKRKTLFDNADNKPDAPDAIDADFKDVQTAEEKEAEKKKKEEENKLPF